MRRVHTKSIGAQDMPHICRDVRVLIKIAQSHDKQVCGHANGTNGLTVWVCCRACKSEDKRGCRGW